MKKDAEHPRLIGPAAAVMLAARAIAGRRDRIALLLDGWPGVGKTAIADALALEITGSPHAIEHVNGQSVGADLVRGWRAASAYGNLFSPWTVKRIDEIDRASSAGVLELLTYLDYQRPHHAIIATTNDFAALKSSWKGRLETRFMRLPVEAPSILETAAHLVTRFRIPKVKATEIARGSVPDGELDGCNVRAATLDAEAMQILMEARK